MLSNLRCGLRLFLLLPAFAGVLLGLAGCGGDAPPAKQRPIGSACTVDAQCERGLCLIPPGESGLRCVATCPVEGEVCSTGGRCVLFEAPQGRSSPSILACTPPPSCSSKEECGANTACVVDAQGIGACQCVTDFHGDPALACGVCTPENAREGCTLNTVSLPEVKGRCRTLDGATVAGSCTSVTDCPDATRYGCFGYLPAVVADPPCSCTDLRKLDLSAASALGNLHLAWYGDSTKWPEGFEPKTSGALGPGAQLTGINLSGPGVTSAERAVLGGERLTPDAPFDGAAQPSFSGENALRHGRVVSGSVQVKIGGAVFSDTEHEVLAGASGAGAIDYRSGTMWLESRPAPPREAIAEAAYRYRVHAVALRPLTATGTTTTFELVGTGAPIVPRTATVRIAPEPLVPDAPPDGSRTTFSFTGTHALRKAPIDPGSVHILAGDVVLADDGSGALSAGDGSSGQVDHATGALSLTLARPPGPMIPLAASYRASRTLVLTPDAPFDGARTRVTFSRARALPLRPVIPGSVQLSIGSVSFTDREGRLVGSNGDSGTIDYETGEIAVTLAAAPAASTSATVTFHSEAAVTLTDRDEPRRLTGDAQGAIDYDGARVHVELAAWLHPNTSAVIDFERQAEKTLVANPPLDGSTRSVTAVLGPAPIGRGSVKLRLGPEVLRPTPAFDGRAREFAFNGPNGLEKRPIAPGTVSLEVGGVRLSDVRADGILSGADGSSGEINYESGAMKLKLARPPPSAAKGVASYAQRLPSVGLTPDALPDGKRREFIFSGPQAGRAPMRPGSAEVAWTEGLVPEAPYDGASTVHTYRLDRAPVAPGGVQLQVGGVVFTESATPGQLVASAGSSGSIDYETGAVELRFATAPAAGTLGDARYEVPGNERVERTLTPDLAFDGMEANHAFSGANALDTTLVPGSLRVVLDPVPLVPDIAFDGVRTAHRFSGANALFLRPIVPGSVAVRVGTTTLKDSRTAGEFAAEDGSAGTIDYASGVMALTLKNAPPGGAASSVAYHAQTTGELLTPDRAFDGKRTRLSFTGGRALARPPLVPGTVTLSIGTVSLTDSTPGRLTGPGGSEGTIDYETGAVTVVLGAAPAVGTSAKASYQSRAAVVLRDGSPGVLTGNDGSGGTVDDISGELRVSFAAAPAPGSSVRASFVRRATLSPEPPFDGHARLHRLTLAKAPVSKGSVTLSIGATTLRETRPGVLTADDGSEGRVDHRSGGVDLRLSTPAPAGTPVLADYRSPAGVALSESGAPGELRASDGSTGRVDPQTGVISLTLQQPPKPGAQATLVQDVPAEVILTDKDGVLSAADGTTGTLDYATGEARLDFAIAPRSGTTLVAAYTQTGSRVERTDLDGIELTGANLTGANLSYTSLRNALLARADLTGADLTGADLTGADLTGAKLKGATLKNANVEGASLAGADIAGADLSGTSGIDPERVSLPEWYLAGTITDCSRISIPDCAPGKYDPKQLVQALKTGGINPLGGGLEGAMLAGADLRGVGDLSGARLKGANLRGADLRDVRLTGADLEGAVLAGADLSGNGDLTGASLKGANLRGANLRGLRLAGADFSNAILEEAILTEVQAPDAVCPATGAPCYDGGRSCRGGAETCAPKEGSALKLTSAALTNARFERALIPGADLSGAVMAGVDLSGTDASRAKGTGTVLEGAGLGGTLLAKATLAGANLKGARTDASSDLRGADLSMASLVGADLRGVNLDGAKLDKADLTRIVANERTRAEGASFLGADLTEACLTNSTLLRGVALTGVRAPRASLAGARLNGTDFTGVDLSGATLSSGASDAQDPCHCTPERGPALCGITAVQGAVFKAANLYGANLSYTDFRGVTMEGVDLRTARLERTDLRSAVMVKAKLAGGDLRTTILSGANLTEANLSGADLSGNELIEPNLSRADLTTANLRRAVLLRANLSGAVLDQVGTDSSTVMRGANLTLSAIRGCIRADLSDAVLKNAALLQAGFVAPGGQTHDGTKDFNCRMDFEGALLPLSQTAACKEAPFPSGWLEAGRASNGVYAKERLVGRLSSVRAQLDCAYLPDVDLRGFDLGRASLRGAKLDKARLGRSDQGVITNLLGAQLQRAQLANANAEWANLRDANLSNAVLTGTSLEHADLRGANLSLVVLDSASKFQLAKYSCAGQTSPGCTLFPNYPTFRWRQLKMLGPQSDLEGVDLNGYPGLSNPPVDLRGANLKEAKFNWTNVSGVSFAGANLGSANFANADVTGANFAGCNLKSANFGGATVSAGTSFSGANIMDANFVATSGTPSVAGSLCNAETSFSSASVAYVFVLNISIEGSFPLYFPVITLEFLPGWKVAGSCCFPVTGGLRIGC